MVAAAAAAPVSGMHHRRDRRHAIASDAPVGQVGGADQAVRADVRLAGEMMEHQHTVGSAGRCGPRSPGGRWRTGRGGTATPGLVRAAAHARRGRRSRRRPRTSSRRPLVAFGAVTAVAGQPGHPVAVPDPLQVPAGRHGSFGAVTLAGQAGLHTRAVFRLVVVAGRVACVVVALADQPAEHVRRVGRVRDAAGRGGAVDRGHVARGDRPPVRLARASLAPALDPRERVPRSAAGSAGSRMCGRRRSGALATCSQVPSCSRGPGPDPRRR